MNSFFNKNVIPFFLLVLVTFASSSCNKEIKKDSNPDVTEVFGASPSPFGSEPTCQEFLQADWTADSILTQTILGPQLQGNPYSLSVMQQASINLYGTTKNIVINSVYVRFKPATYEQLDQLLDTDIEVFDHPLDRDVIQQGDYYPQAGIGAEEIPWLYAVLQQGYQPPAGITYQVLQYLHVPDQDIWMENEAFRITGNPYNDSCNLSLLVLPPPCPAPDNPLCEPNPGGGGGLPPADAKTPAGYIYVYDNTLNQPVPVRKTRIVSRRYFKIDRSYTDDQGYFRSTKRFKNKVNIVVKFKNADIKTRALRLFRWWQMLLPIEQGLGKYSGTLNTINYVFNVDGNRYSRRHKNWWAAQCMNSYQEYNQYAMENNMGILPSKLKVIIAGFLQGGGTGSTPMNAHRPLTAGAPSFEYFQYYLINRPVNEGAAYFNAFINGLVFRFYDMALGFTEYSQFFKSEYVKSLMYHELSHAAHFQKIGQFSYNDLVTAETYTVTKYFLNSTLRPYGDGSDGAHSNFIALGESWANYIEQVFTDRHYGSNCATYNINGYFYTANAPVTGLNSSRINYLEDYSPYRIENTIRWLPIGLYYDLLDNRNDLVGTRIALDDQVSGYTNKQFFDALDGDIKSPQNFKQRLLLENNNNQVQGVNTIFTFYNY